MRNLILSGVCLFWIAAAAAILSLLQFVMADFTNLSPKIYDGPCSFVSWDKNGSSVEMKLSCNQKKTFTLQADIIVNYLKKPAPIYCTVPRVGQTKCRLQKEH